MQPSSRANGDSSKEGFTVERANPTNVTLKAILSPYAMSQFISAIVGGFGMCEEHVCSS